MILALCDEVDNLGFGVDAFLKAQGIDPNLIFETKEFAPVQLVQGLFNAPESAKIRASALS